MERYRGLSFYWSHNLEVIGSSPIWSTHKKTDLQQYASRCFGFYKGHAASNEYRGERGDGSQRSRSHLYGNGGHLYGSGSHHYEAMGHHGEFSYNHYKEAYTHLGPTDIRLHF